MLHGRLWGAERKIRKQRRPISPLLPAAPGKMECRTELPGQRGIEFRRRARLIRCGLIMIDIQERPSLRGTTLFRRNAWRM